jgi:hypothetical protein
LNSKIKGGSAKKRKAALIEMKKVSSKQGGQMKSCLPNLIANLRDKDLGVKAAAADVMADIAMFDPNSVISATDILMHNMALPLKTPEAYAAKGNSAKVLGYIAHINPTKLQPAVTPLIEALKPPAYVPQNPSKSQAALYAGAAFCLANIVAHSPNYVRGPVPAVGVAAQNSDLDVRYFAILGLEAIAKKHPEYLAQSVPAVAKNITYPLYRADNSTPQMDRLYIGALFVIGKVAQTNPKGATEAIAPVVSCLRDTYVFAQWCSPQAVADKNGMRAITTKTVGIIQKTNPSALTPILIERLGEERDVGNHFESVFLTIARDHPEVVAHYVLTGINKPSTLIRRRFIKAVGFIAATRPELVVDTIPILLDYLKDRDRFLRQAAVFALGGIGIGSRDHIKQVVPHIIKAFDDTYENVQIEAIQAIENIWMKDPMNLGSAIGALNKCLHAQHLNIRNRAMLALKNMNIDVNQYMAFVNEIENTKKIVQEAAEAGTSIKPAQEILRQAYNCVERRDWTTAIRYVKEAGETMKKLQMSARPTLSIQATTPTALNKGNLVEVTLHMENVGSATAKQIKVNLPDDVEVSGMGLIPPIDPGKVRSEIISMRPVETLQFLRVEVIYFDNDDLEYQSDVDVMVTSAAYGAGQREVLGQSVHGEYGGMPGKQKSVTGAVDFSAPDFMTTGKRREVEQEVKVEKNDPSPGMKFCMHCGSEIPKESAFCFRCGQQQR